jgi:hypothetical protein
MTLDAVLDELLIGGLDDRMMAADVDFLARQQLGPAGEDEERGRSIEVIRMAVEGGYMHLGDLLDQGRFAPWDLDHRAVLERVRSSWEALARPVSLYEVCWLENTEKGNARAHVVLAQRDQGSDPDS